jgi:hypothetical protein
MEPSRADREHLSSSAASLQQPSWHRLAAWALLGVAGICIVLLPSEMRGFPRGTQIGIVSAHGMGLASSLSPKTGFVMYQMALRNADGDIEYTPYNPWPPIPFSLIRGAMAIGGSSLSRQVTSARTLMHLFMFAALIVAFLILRIIFKNEIASATATVLAFSSYYAMAYNDLVYNDVPALFGCLLVVHGIVLFWKSGGYRQLVAKSLIAVSLGWQVFAVLGAFAVVSLCRRWSRAGLVEAARGRTTRLLVIVAAYGVVIIAVNLVNETRLTGTPIRELRTLHSSFLHRLGMEDRERRADVTAWGPFNQLQLYRLGRAVAPYAPVKTDGDEDVRRTHSLESAEMESFLLLRIIGVVAAVACLVLLLLSTSRRCLAVLALAGPLWVYPLRYFTGPHEYQSLYYIGIPLVLFSTLIARIPLSKTIPQVAVVVIAGVVFAMSHFSMNQWKAENSVEPNAITADFQNIVEETKPGSTVLVSRRYRMQQSKLYWELPFYLRGRYLTLVDSQADYVIHMTRSSRNVLTPDNMFVFVSGVR